MLSQVVPNLPQPGDRFSTANDLLVACYLALLPVYGNGAAISASVRTAIVVDCLRSRIRSSDPSGGGCKWRIGAVQDSKTKEIIVSSDKSHLLHNHGPAEALKEDSTWRPPVQNPLVRSALGLPPLEPRSRIQVRSCYTYVGHSLTVHRLFSGIEEITNSLETRRTIFQETQLHPLPIRLVSDFQVFSLLVNAHALFYQRSIEFTSLKLFSFRSLSSTRFLFDHFLRPSLSRSRLLDASIALLLHYPCSHCLDFSRSNSHSRAFTFLP